MRTEAFASPLTVWVGPMMYVFAPGRDVFVGYGSRYDIPLDRPGNAAPTLQPMRPDLVLRFAGTHWVAIDSSPNGIFVDGNRVSTVDIRDSQVITIGDPQRGPRLVFKTGPSAGPPGRPPGPPQGRAYPPPPPPPPPPVAAQPPPPPPPVAAQPNRPNAPIRPDLRVPTERDTQPMQVPAPQPPTVERPTKPVRRGPAAPAPVGPFPPTEQSSRLPGKPPPPEEDERPKVRGLIGRMTDATRNLRPARPEPQPDERSSTYRLPLKSDARTVGVAAYRLGLTVDGRGLLTDVSFTARPGTLTAIIGPSTARNSALLGLLSGTTEPSSGRITVDEHDVHAEHESMRTRIGIVRRDDRIHSRLTVERALRYAAELRLPPDTSPDHRHRVVKQVLDELELTPHHATPIGKLSPDMRRCASMAVELITRPTLLVVDEPSTGLDATQENHVMAMLRRQADLGCVVVAMTLQTSLTHLNMCDQVLLITPAGAMAFAGPPWQIESAMGTTDWPEIFAQESADPRGGHHAFLARQQPLAPTAPPPVAAPGPPPAELPVERQIWLVARRQARLLVADRVYFLFLAVLPFVLAALTLLIPGDSGLGRPRPSSPNPHEAIEILAALNIAAVIMGTALTIRDLVGERRVLRREQSVGLSTSAYLVGKLIVFSVAAAIQTAILTTIVIVGKGGPVHGAVLLRNPDVELYLSVAATGIVSAIVGLALSAQGNRLREVLLLLVPVILASLLFDGSLVPLVSKWGFQQISWFVPAQWGFAASASTVDLRRVDALAANAEMWTHYSGWWVFDMIMLILFGAVGAGFVLYRLRAPQREIRGPSLHREQQELSDLHG